ncbi:MAG: hypothetical protein LJE69_07725 [Thiohalocapsa sp.]|uniref:FimV/HubP family polar landmark protein n=1 Tax=Thiohalocapsa sp. TaxID=2497641 RepID=UPI0025E2D675|nr:FimV/HubP family polar landmark protein [Thiohalocapsa sp.]MCG6941124.1 hypothetical protein [Thiohalocapsa sp.]
MLPKPPLLIAVALLLALISEVAAALGLGGMRTQSALNQPFYAEIELTGVRTDEIDAVKARLASREEFAKAGAERPHFLTRLQFTPAIGTDGRPYIQVSSREPIREPYIDFLVEVLWPQGRLVKEYTVLLDPPARGRAAPPRVVAPRTSLARRRAPPEPEPAPPLRHSAPAPTQQQAQQQARAQARAASMPRPAPAPVPPQARSTRFPLYYGPVRRGATLTGIARELTPPGATVEQTAMALFRNNQDAFLRGNINLLQVGANLVVPTAEELFALDPAAAQRQFQDALAGRSVNTSPITDVPSDVRLRIAGGGQAPAGDAAPTAGPFPSLATSPPGAAPASLDPALRNDLLMVQETTESNRQETTELRNRIGELEQQLADIQRLLQLRNEQLDQLRLAERAARAEPGIQPLPVPAAPYLPASDAGAPDRSAADQAAAVQQPVPPAVTAMAGVELLPRAGDRSPVARDGEPGAVAAAGAAEAPSPAPSAASAATTTPAPTALDMATGTATGTATASVPATGESDATKVGKQPFWAGILSTAGGVARAVPPWALVAALAAVLLGALGLLAYRRRRQLIAEEAEAETAADLVAARSEPLPDAGPEYGFEVASTTGEIDLDTLPDLDSDAPLHGSTTSADAGPAIDVQTGLPISVVSNIPPSQQETQEADVIAEADIYILYGRYREAEALLREELEHAPERPDLKYKLGEALLGSGNRAALAELLESMRGAGDDKREPAKWTSLEAGLAGLGPGEEGAPAAAAPRIKPLAAAPIPMGSGEALSGEMVQSSDMLGDSDDTGLGFSVREVNPSSAERLREQMADLELDLQEMDDFGTNLESTQSAGDAPAPPVYTEDLSGYEPTEGPAFPAAPVPAAPSPAAEQPGGEGLDLDLDELERLTATPADSAPDDLTLPVPDALPDLSAVPGAGDDDELEDSRSPLPDPLSTAVSQGSPTELYQETVDGGPAGDSISSDVLSSQWRMDSGLWDEAGTKLDLARAYIEMEDADAARAILEEVVQEGSEEQREDASALLAKIG